MLLPRGSSRLRTVRHGLRRWLETHRLSEETNDAVVLATHEALALAIQGDTTTPDLLIRVRVDDDEVTVEIEDRAERPDRRLESPTGGAATLIEALVSRFEVRHDDRATTIRLAVPR